MRPRFYVAGKFEHADRVRLVRDELLRRGWELSFDWLETAGLSLRQIADAQVTAVRSSRCVVALLDGGRGTHFEMGLAVGARVPLVLWSGNPYVDFGTESERTVASYHSSEIVKFARVHGQPIKKSLLACAVHVDSKYGR